MASGRRSWEQAGRTARGRVGNDIRPRPTPCSWLLIEGCPALQWDERQSRTPCARLSSWVQSPARRLPVVESCGVEEGFSSASALASRLRPAFGVSPLDSFCVLRVHNPLPQAAPRQFRLCWASSPEKLGFRLPGCTSYPSPNQTRVQSDDLLDTQPSSSPTVFSLFLSRPRFVPCSLMSWAMCAVGTLLEPQSQEPWPAGFSSSAI